MIGCIIQARMGSTRLPGKVLKKLDENNSVLSYVINQVKCSKLINRIVIATTTLDEDDVIAKYCKEINVECFRGDPQDVLDRYYKCAKYFSFSNIVRITSDTPLIDPTIIDQVVERFLSSKYDYVCNTQPRTFPQGTETEVFSFLALEKIWHKSILPSEREHVTPYFYTHPKDFQIFNVKTSKNISNLRWCIDKKNDLDLVRFIVHGIKSRPILTKDILQFLINKPNIKKLNQDHTIDEGYLKSLQEDKEFLGKI